MNNLSDLLSDNSDLLNELGNLLGDLGDSLSDDLDSLSDRSWVDTAVVWRHQIFKLTVDLSDLLGVSLWVESGSLSFKGGDLVLVVTTSQLRFLVEFDQSSNLLDLMGDLLQFSGDNSLLSGDLSDALLLDADSVNDALFLLNQLLDGSLEDSLLLDDLGDGGWSDWLWNWSVHSSDSLLDVDNLVNKLLDDLVEVDDLLLDNWSLWSRSSWKSLLEVGDLLLNNLDLLDDLVDLLLEDVDNVLLFLSQWLGWLLLLWSWFSWSSNNGVDSLLDVVNSLGDLSDLLLNSDNLLLDDWLLWSWGNNSLLSQLLNVVDKMGNLLGQLVNSLLEFSDNSGFLVGQWSDWLRSSWESDLVNNVVDLLDLLDDSDNLLSENWNLW